MAATVRKGCSVSEMRNYFTEDLTDDVAGGNTWEDSAGSESDREQDAASLAEDVRPDRFGCHSLSPGSVRVLGAHSSSEACRFCARISVMRR